MRWGHLLPWIAVVGGLGAAGCAAPSAKPAPRAGAATVPPAIRDRVAIVSAVTADWSDVSAMAAERMMERYGFPDKVHPRSLVWREKGPWKRTVVRDIDPPPARDAGEGIVEQTVDYALSPKRASAVLAFDRRLSYSARKQELSARSDREETNFLLMNLADDIAQGRLDPARARLAYAGIVDFEQSGKTSSYLQALHFETPETLLP